MAAPTKTFQFSPSQQDIAAQVNVNFDDLVLYISNRNDGTATWDAVYINQTATADSLKVQDGGVTVLEVYDGGIIDMPKQSFARAYRNGNVTNGVGTSATKVAFNAESYDIQGEFDSTTNNRFVATKAGYYRVVGQVESPTLGAANLKLIVFLYKNGSEFSRKTELSGGTGDISCQHTDVVQLAASDYVEIFTSTTAAAAKDITGGEGRTFVSVEKIL